MSSRNNNCNFLNHEHTQNFLPSKIIYAITVSNLGNLRLTKTELPFDHNYRRTPKKHSANNNICRIQINIIIITS